MARVILERGENVEQRAGAQSGVELGIADHTRGIDSLARAPRGKLEHVPVTLRSAKGDSISTVRGIATVRARHAWKESTPEGVFAAAQVTARATSTRSREPHGRTRAANPLEHGVCRVGHVRGALFGGSRRVKVGTRGSLGSVSGRDT